MKHTTQPEPTALAVATVSRKRALVLYDDFAAADDAVEFALNLDGEVGIPMERPLAHWWLDMVEVSGVAAAVGRELAESPYVILALSGACKLSSAVRQWLAESLAHPNRQTTALMVLIDEHCADGQQVAEVRAWLEQVTAGKDVNLFFYGSDGSTSASNVITAGAMHGDRVEDDCFVGACDAFPRTAWAA